MNSEVIERTFPVSGRASLKLSNITGSITLQPGEAGQISVTATKHNENGSNRTEITMEQAEDGQVVVSTRFTEGMLAFLSFNKPCDVDYVVRLPSTCEAKISGVSCWVSAQGLDGELEFKTVSGEMRLADLAGSISADSVSGDLAAERIKGSLRLKSVSGSYKLQQVEASTIDATSVSGAFRLQTSLGAGPFRFQTVSGDVKLELPAETSCQAELHTVSGELRVGFPVAHSSKSRGKWQANIGQGGPAVSLGSISGNLVLTGPNGESQRVSTPAQEEPAAPPPPPVPEIDRQAILERVEKGEISVEEAVRALQGK